MIQASLRALSFGPEVTALRNSRHSTGDVLAVLSDAIYLLFSEGYVVCILPPHGIDGPLSLRIDNFPALQAHTTPNAQVSANPEGMTIGTRHLDWQDASNWTPTLPPTIGDARAGEEAARTLAMILTRTRRVPDRYFAHTLQDRIANLGEAARTGQVEQSAQALISLIGLGEGLTPTGDDLVMGLMACLVWQARLRAFDQTYVQSLVTTVRSEAPHRTNHISARLLWHACDGILYAPAMELGAALLAGDVNRVTQPAHHLLALGHTSGSEMANGILLASTLTLTST